jgi:hypothetical protein
MVFDDIRIKAPYRVGQSAENSIPARANDPKPASKANVCAMITLQGLAVSAKGVWNNMNADGPSGGNRSIKYYPSHQRCVAAVLSVVIIYRCSEKILERAKRLPYIVGHYYQGVGSRYRPGGYFKDLDI